jgi:hypothetical protein
MSRAALVVGIDAYPGGPLAGCVNDARRVEKLLATHANGDPNFQTELLTAPDRAITRALLRERVEALLQTSAEVAIFYFSGHGTKDVVGGYLVTPDAQAYDEGFPMDTLLALANRSEVREVVIILDCCHSGAFGKSAALGAPTSLVHLEEGVSVLTASREEESAMEVGGAGIFTSLLCGALEGGAADVLGKVTIASAYAYVDEALGVFEQRPLFKANVSQLFPLRLCAPAVERASLRRLPEIFPAQDAAPPLDPSWEPTAPEADPARCQLMKLLQQMRAAGLVEPVGTEHLYYAAMERKPVRLTPLGRHYWRLARDRRI